MSRTRSLSSVRYLIASIVFSLSLAACGGGSEGDTTNLTGTGGSGNAGVPSSGTGTTTTPPATDTTPPPATDTTPPPATDTTPPPATDATPPSGEVVSKSWNTAHPLDSSGGVGVVTVDGRQVAFNGNGTALAMWNERERIYTSRFSVAGGWESAQLLPTDGLSGAIPTQIRLAAGIRGNAIAVWGEANNLYASRYTPEGGWGPVQLLEAGIASNFKVELAHDDNGNAIAVWMVYDTANLNDISAYARSYTPSGGWGPKQLIADNISNTYSFTPPDIAFDGSGNAIAIWPVRGGIYARRYTQTGGWGDPQPVIQSGFRGDNPQIAVDRNGNAIAVWERSDNIYASRFTVSSGWEATEQRINADDSAESSWAVFPKIGFDVNGNAIAVWAQRGRSSATVNANRYSPNGGWGTAQRIGSALPNIWPDVAVSANGEAMAIWRTDPILAARYTPANGWGEPQIAGTGDGNFLENPQIAMDGNGNAIAMWAIRLSTTVRLYVNRFD